MDWFWAFSDPVSILDYHLDANTPPTARIKQEWVLRIPESFKGINMND